MIPSWPPSMPRPSRTTNRPSRLRPAPSSRHHHTMPSATASAPENRVRGSAAPRPRRVGQTTPQPTAAPGKNRPRRPWIRRGAVLPQKTQAAPTPKPKPKYCSSKLNSIGSALDTFGRVQQGTAFAAIVLTGGAATEGAAPAYLLGTAIRYAGTTLQVISGNRNAAGSGLASLFTVPAELSPVGDTVTGSVAGLITRNTVPDPCS